MRKNKEKKEKVEMRNEKKSIKNWDNHEIEGK